MDSTQNFSGLAQQYELGRPAYAEKFIDTLYSKYGFGQESVIADIGSGTGKLAKQLLDRGSFVYCVEPNADMRNAAADTLEGYEKLRIVDGAAAETGLDRQSVDFVTTAQAFHWFDPELFKRECRRILRREGTVFLIWNIRDRSDEINQLSFEIYSEFCPDFKGLAEEFKRMISGYSSFLTAGMSIWSFRTLSSITEPSLSAAAYPDLTR